jgi:hypothetical protein
MPPFQGLTQREFDHCKANYERFNPNPVRINNYNDPMQNTVDRNWQERLRTDPSYPWNRSDQRSYSRNSSFGPHNAAEQLERMFYP